MYNGQRYVMQLEPDSELTRFTVNVCMGWCKLGQQWFKLSCHNRVYCKLLFKV
jgi:hypothetical protein